MMRIRRCINNGQGVVAFNGANNNNSTGYSFADFLIGDVSTGASRATLRSA